MTVKQLKEYLEKFGDDVEVIAETPNGSLITVDDVDYDEENNQVIINSFNGVAL